jgi:hypothetical protein
MRGSAPWASRRFSQARNTHRTTPPASISQIEGDRPSHSGADGFGWMKPHSPVRRMPNTTSPRPIADKPVPTRSSRTRVSGFGSAIRRVRTRITATTTTSPTNTRRHDRYVVNRPPMRGPAATAIAPADATSP